MTIISEIENDVKSVMSKIEKEISALEKRIELKRLELEAEKIEGKVMKLEKGLKDKANYALSNIERELKNLRVKVSKFMDEL